MAQEINEFRSFLKTMRKLRQLDWQAVYRDHGLKWEQVQGAPGRFTIRLSRSCRAIIRREGEFMRFIALHADHDQTYEKR